MKKQVNSLKNNLSRTDRLWLAGSFMLFFITTAWGQLPDESTVKRCGTTEYEKFVLQMRNPQRARQVNELNRRIEEAKASGKMARLADNDTVYRIPIVVHVIHNNSSGVVGGINNSNISDEQIASQIQVLNEDYRRQSGTNGYNTSPIGADAKIEFYLATTDPNGQPSNGITRHYYAQKSSFNVFTDDVLLSQIAYWPSDRYLNIWVTTLQGNYLGYTQFPTAADTLQGLPTVTDEMVDGSIIDYRYFGRQTGTVTSSLYALGRTTTHEIGHWLGLIHPWGDANCGEDYVADTPLMQDRSDSPRNCTQTYSNCTGTQVRDMLEDYMTYWPDNCMNLFTQGQVDRMRAVLQLSPRRAKLLKSLSALPETETLTINVYPNPTGSDKPTVDVQLKGFQSFSVDLLDMSGRQVRTISYTDAPSTRVSLSVDGLASGLYVVRVKTANESSSKRLLVQ
ncbi:M43 family zinc metalloprotease [Spirosoma sp. SC4-14]|uniref:M43 family zinc metalloprotease n=1 Tax=Spirosoma sp. SC4-14 TaxID=3128900 RepID=UPI0030CF8CCE